MIEALLIFISLWLVAASVARYRENLKIRKLTEPMVKAHEEGIISFATGIKKVVESQERIEQFLIETLMEDPLPPEEASRVYAAILRSGAKLRLHMLEATSVAEFKDKSEDLIGEGWKADVIEYLDIKPLKEKIVYRDAPKAINLNQGLHFLQLVRDRFADKPMQKKSLEGVINNYKKTYGIS